MGAHRELAGAVMWLDLLQGRAPSVELPTGTVRAHELVDDDEERNKGGRPAQFGMACGCGCGRIIKKYEYVAGLHKACSQRLWRAKLKAERPEEYAAMLRREAVRKKRKWVEAGDAA